MPNIQHPSLIELLATLWKRQHQKNRERTCRIRRAAAKLALEREPDLPPDQQEQLKKYCDGAASDQEVLRDVLRGGGPAPSPAWRARQKYEEETTLAENAARPGWGWTAYSHALQIVFRNLRVPCDKGGLGDLCLRAHYGALKGTDNLMVDLNRLHDAGLTRGLLIDLHAKYPEEAAEAGLPLLNHDPDTLQPALVVMADYADALYAVVEAMLFSHNADWRVQVGRPYAKRLLMGFDELWTRVCQESGPGGPPPSVIRLHDDARDRLLGIIALLAECGDDPRKTYDEYRHRLKEGARIDSLTRNLRALVGLQARETDESSVPPGERATGTRKAGGYKTTCDEESKHRQLSAWEVAKERGEASVRNAPFPGLNKLAAWCGCNPHTMRTAIEDSPVLQRAEAAYKLQRAGSAAKSEVPDDPSWPMQVDEALRVLIECAPESRRGELNTPEMRHQLATMKPDALGVLVADAKTQFETRRKASMRACARTNSHS